MREVTQKRRQVSWLVHGPSTGCAPCKDKYSALFLFLYGDGRSRLRLSCVGPLLSFLMLEFPQLKQLHSNPHSWFTRKHGHFDFLGPSRQEMYLLSYFTLLWPHLQETSMVYPTSLVEEQAACMVEFSHLLHLQLREQKCPEITQGQWLCPLSSFVQDAFSLSLALFFPQEHTLLIVFWV